MLIEEHGITFTFYPNNEENAKKFFETYEFAGFDFLITSEKIGLKDKKQRTCRFCKKSYPKVKFENKAHTIPEFLGNKYSISDFECDTCNKLFGKYEKQLSNYFGLAIPANRTKGKKKIPSSNSYDKKITAKRTDFFGAKTAIEIASTNNEVGNIQYNKTDNTLSVKFETEPYKPIEVYKAFLKMALGLLPEEFVEDYKLSFDFLQKKELSEKIKDGMISVYVHNFDKAYNYNGIVLFKTREDCAILAPPFTMVLFYGQSMHQIYLPIQKEYIISRNGKKITYPLLPPVLPEKNHEEIKCSYGIERLDSSENKTSTHYLSIIHTNPNEERVTVDSDGNLKEAAEFNSEKITKIIIIDDPDFAIQLDKTKMKDH
jgi:HNH endonuclease